MDYEAFPGPRADKTGLWLNAHTVGRYCSLADAFGQAASADLPSRHIPKGARADPDPL